MPTQKTTDAIKILKHQLRHDPDAQEKIEKATLNARVAQAIYQARTEAKLSQRALAKLIGTKQPVIARLEDADYDGHSLSMLQRIAAALNKTISIKLEDAKSPVSDVSVEEPVGAR